MEPLPPPPPQTWSFPEPQEPPGRRWIRTGLLLLPRALAGLLRRLWAYTGRAVVAIALMALVAVPAGIGTWYLMRYAAGR